MFRRIVLLCLFTLMALPGAQAADETTRELFEVTQRFAEAGSREGQFKLAEMYEQGQGTPVDLDEALAWYRKAAGAGHEEARRRVENWDARQRAREEERRQAELARQQAQEQAREQALAAERAAEQERAAREEAERRAREAARRKAEQERRAAQARREAERQAAAERARREQEARAREAAQRRAAEEKAAAAEPKAPAPEPAPQRTGTPAAENGGESFEVDPCKTPAARFMSTCR